MTGKRLKKNDFSQEVEIFAAKNGLELFDALREYCDKFNIEYDRVGTLISNSLKNKLEREAKRKHLIKTKKRKIHR